MEPFKALIVPLDEPTQPPIGGGGGPRPDHDLPLFPFHPIVVPPGGAWPGEPPISGGGPRPDNDLPLFPFHPIVVPPGGSWPDAPYPDQGLPGEQPYPDNTLPGEQPRPDQGLPGQQPRPDQGLPPFPDHPIVLPPEGGTTPPPTGGSGGPRPSNPINLPPNDSGYWVFVYIQGVGWVWIAIPPQKSVTVGKKK